MSNVIAAVFTVVYLSFVLWHCRSFRFHTRALCCGAITGAMTMVLSCIYLPLPTGASISLGSWLPLMVLALCYDDRLAMITGLLCGMAAPFVLPGWSLVHWAQYFLEYMTIFSCMGFAGLFGYEKKGKLILGALIAISLRFWAQVLSGVVFFGQYAWEGFSAWGYSLLFHLSGKVPEGILTVAVLLALPMDRLSRSVKRGNKK